MSDYQLYERYLEDALSDEERQDFELRLKSDAEFKEDFEMHMKSQKVFDLLLEEDLRKEFASLKTENQTKVVKLFPYKTVLSVAASLIVLLSAYYFLNVKDGFNNQDLVNEHFVFDELASLRGEQTEVDNLEMYSIAYKEALTLLKDNPNAAIQKLEYLQGRLDGAYLEKVEWNLALAYLQAKQMEKTQSLLSTISKNKNHLYRSKARVLLSKLPK